MAKRTEYVCDRCGESAGRGMTIASEGSWPVGYTAGGQRVYTTSAHFRPRDLCAGCVDALEDWLNAPVGSRREQAQGG